MGVIDIRRFGVATYFDASGQLLVGDVWPEAEDELEVQLTDVIRVNALAVPARASVQYRVLRTEEFKASAGHVKRFTRAGASSALFRAP